MRGLWGGVAVAAMVASGCDELDFDGDSSGPPPPGEARQVRTQVVLPAQGHVYDPAIVAGPEAFLVSWTEHHAHAGDVQPSPDIVARLLRGSELDPTSTVMTPYAKAQLRSRPFVADAGFAIAWGDDLPLGFPDRQMRWRALKDGPAVDPDAAHAVSVQYSQQRDASSVVALGDRAMVVFREISGAQHRLAASFFDVANGAIVHEVEIANGQFAGDALSVAAGGDRFALLRLTGHSNGPLVEHELTAWLFDRDGQVAVPPQVIPSRFPSGVGGPVGVAFDGTAFLFPVLDFVTVTVDRPCCEICGVIQPDTCTIDDYDIHVGALYPDGRIDDLGCLDCRTDVGTHVPRVVADRGAAYFHWDNVVARVNAFALPGGSDQWRRIEQDVEPGYTEGYTGLAVREGAVVLVGRGGEFGGPTGLVVATFDY